MTYTRYTKQEWQNDRITSPYGPVSGDRLQHLEDGLDAASQALTPIANGSVTYVAAASGDTTGAMDTATIQTAINACAATGGTVAFAAGLYYINAPLTLKSRVNLVGCGGQFQEGAEDISALRTTIKLANGANCDMLVNDPAAPIRPGQDGTHRWQRSRIEGVTLQGNRTNQTDHTKAIVRFTKAWSVKFDNVALIDAAGYCIYLDNCNVIDAESLTLQLAHKSCAYLLGTQDCSWVNTEAGGSYESVLVLDGAYGNDLDGKWFNANPHHTTLTADVSAGATTLPVAATASFRYPDGTLLIGTEQIDYTDRTSLTAFTGLTRGAHSTVAASHVSGTRVQEYVTNAYSVYVINAANANRITGRFDQSYSGAVYIDATSQFNVVIGRYLQWGWDNAAGQAAITCLGSFNTFNGAAQKSSDLVVANTTIGVSFASGSLRNLFSGTLDSGLATRVSYGDSAAQQNNTVIDGGGRNINVGITGLLSNGPILLDNNVAGGGYMSLLGQTTPPGAGSAGRARIYSDTSSGNMRLLAVFPGGLVVPFAYEDPTVQAVKRTLFGGRAILNAVTAQTTSINEAGTNAISGTSGGLSAIYIDPADFPLSGRSVKISIDLEIITNSTAPVCTFTVSLVPLSLPTGAAGAVSLTAGSSVSGSSAAVASPAANSTNHASSGDFAIPTAGYYAIQLVVSANMAASSAVAVRATLRSRNL